MPTKHDKYYHLMLAANEPLFAQFSTFTQEDLSNPSRAAEFDQIGREVLDTIRFWERKLCAGMERGQHSHYSVTLAEKFWQQVRAEYPLIDQVGIKRTLIHQ